MEAKSTLTSVTITSGFHALSDPIRLRVLELLRKQELCVCDLSDALELTQSKLSFHLKTLKEAGLVNARQQGRWIYYSLNPHQFALLEQYLSTYLKCETFLPANDCPQRN